MAAEPSDESKWLKSHYEEAATGDVPTPSKRVKYGEESVARYRPSASGTLPVSTE